MSEIKKVKTRLKKKKLCVKCQSKGRSKVEQKVDKNNVRKNQFNKISFTIFVVKIVLAMFGKYCPA